MKRRTPYALLTSILLAAAGCVGQEKSENYLSPMVAGPIPGISISAPTPTQPTQGSTIVVNQQPVTLSLANATTSGVRPLSYAFEVATDSNFTNLIFVRTGVTPGENGQTRLQLPDALQSGRSYYWRARAEDGANTGPYTYPVVFTITNFLGKPLPIAPSGDISKVTPSFVIGNAPRAGAVGGVSYQIEVSESDHFVNPVAVWITNEDPGQTAFDAPGAVPANKVLFWRVRGADTTTIGEWSDVQAFKTPNVAPPPTSGGGGGGGGSCKAPWPSSPVEIMRCVTGNITGGAGPAVLLDLLKRIARAFNEAGVDSGGRGGFGVLQKGAGHNCLGYSCDILCAGQGSNQGQWDIWIGGDPQSPIFGGPLTAAGGARVDKCDIQ